MNISLISNSIFNHFFSDSSCHNWQTFISNWILKHAFYKKSHFTTLYRNFSNLLSLQEILLFKQCVANTCKAESEVKLNQECHQQTIKLHQVLLSCRSCQLHSENVRHANQYYPASGNFWQIRHFRPTFQEARYITGIAENIKSWNSAFLISPTNMTECVQVSQTFCLVISNRNSLILSHTW